MSAHAQVVVCPQRSMAEQALLCAQRHLCPNGGCKNCETCHLLKIGNHPDYLVVERRSEGGKKEASIKVDQIRWLCAELSVKPHLGEKRFVAILEADKMVPAAQNALLKALEEPWTGCAFALFTENRERLLPTILSRCGRQSTAEKATSLSPEFRKAVEESLSLGFSKEYSKMESILAQRPEDAAAVLNAMIEVLGQMICVEDATEQERAQAYRAAQWIRALSACLALAEANVGKRQIYGSIAARIQEEKNEDGSGRQI